MLDMYAEYVEEREGKQLEVLENKAFAVWSIQKHKDEDVLYVDTIYVREKYRREKISFLLTNIICNKAKDRYGVKKMYGSADIGLDGFEKSLQGFIAYGMRKSHIVNELIYYVKDI